MRNRSAVAAIVLAGSFLAPRAADAEANKEHQQIMAELRMLQEQQSQLLRGIEGLNEQLRLITTKIDDQTGTTRKAFADQKLLIDGVAEASRILREKADDTNVRLSTMTQEMQSLRQTIASMPAPTVAPPVLTGDPGVVDPAAPTTPAAPVAPPPNISPTQMFDRVSADYAAGQYRSRDRRLPGVHPHVPDIAAGRRCAAVYREFLSVRREVQGSAAGLPEVDHRLSAG